MRAAIAENSCTRSGGVCETSRMFASAMISSCTSLLSKAKLLHAIEFRALLSANVQVTFAYPNKNSRIFASATMSSCPHGEV